MATPSTPQLHWSQRVALVRYALHAACRSGEFAFFSNLQTAGFLDGTNHVADLADLIGDNADLLLAAVDNLNTSLAYIHQDAFHTVYDNLNTDLNDGDLAMAKSKLFTNITMQKSIAGSAIDHMVSSAITIIEHQPEHVQDKAANVWINGLTIISDCIQVTLHEMGMLECKLADCERMEEGWNTVKSSVVSSVTGLKCVFSLMDQDVHTQPPSPRRASVASMSGAIFRRFSNTFAKISPTASRHGSIVNAIAVNSNSNVQRSSSFSSIGALPVYKLPEWIRKNTNAVCPPSMLATNAFQHQQHKLSTIPPTPAAEQLADPFDVSAPPMPHVSASTTDV